LWVALLAALPRAVPQAPARGARTNCHGLIIGNFFEQSLTSRKVAWAESSNLLGSVAVDTGNRDFRAGADIVMTTPKEVELKLALPPASLPRLKTAPLVRARGKRGKSETQVSVYFDTETHKLLRNGLSLRVRRVGRRYMQTIKSSGDGGPFERGEWESEIADEKPDLRLARGTALEPLLGRKLKRKLRPMFETRVRRTTYPLADGKQDIALTLDKGRIDAGERSEPLCEIELELRDGDKAALFEVARELAQTVPVQLATKSKAERGYALLTNNRVTALKAEPVALGAGASTRDGFRVIGRACLEQVIGNEPALLAGDPEGVHQMRVGVRRLRAAISLFSGLLRDPQTAAIKRELKWLTGELGPARELHVMLTRVVAPVRRRHARSDGVVTLSKDLDERRAAAVKRAQDAVQSPRFRALALDVAAWLEAGQWTEPEDDLLRERGEAPIEAYAAAELDRRWRKIRKRGGRLAQLDPASRHKLRIQAKKVRYASEFFAGVFPGKRAAKRRQKFLSALEGVQDCLGDLNDIAVHEDLMAAMARAASRRRRRNPKRAFAAGLLTGREDARLDTVLAAATEACTALAKVKPFWR
jgi:inorganic triphosphatase YgiF